MKRQLDVFVNDIGIENPRQQQQFLYNKNLKVTKLLEESTNVILYKCRHRLPGKNV